MLISHVKNVQIRSFFWSIFFCIWAEYGDLLHKSPYSVRIQENTDQKNLRIRTLLEQSWLSEEARLTYLNLTKKLIFLMYDIR